MSAWRPPDGSGLDPRERVFDLSAADPARAAAVNWELVFGQSFAWDGRAVGYKMLADVGVDALLANPGDMNSLLAYPIFFCYRHYLELRLKELVISARNLRDIADGNPLGHDLSAVWSICRPLVCPSFCSTRDADAIEGIVAEINGIDPDPAVGFRYPVKTDGRISLPEDLRHVDLRQIAEVLHRLENVLDGISTAIHEATSAKLEFEDEARAAFE